jgi:hypothetical protein
LWSGNICAVVQARLPTGMSDSMTSIGDTVDFGDSQYARQGKKQNSLLLQLFAGTFFEAIADRYLELSLFG